MCLIAGLFLFASCLTETTDVYVFSMENSMSLTNSDAKDVINYVSSRMNFDVIQVTVCDCDEAEGIAQAKQIDNTLSYYKLPLDNGKIMIYTSLAATEQQAKRFKQQCAGSVPDAWIFKRRVR